MTIMKVAAIQMRSGVSPERNAADVERMVREAANLGSGIRFAVVDDVGGSRRLGESALFR